MISKTICGVVELLHDVHEKLPVSFFKLLSPGGAVDDFDQVPECMQDRWSAEMIKTYGPTFRSSEFWSILVFIAVLVMLDTTQIEARHASIRRTLFIRSTQTNLASLEAASAEFVFRRMRAMTLSASRPALMCARRWRGANDADEVVTKSQEAGSNRSV